MTRSPETGDWDGLAPRAVMSGEFGAFLKELAMLDVVFLAIGLGFFAAAGFYLFACDRL